MGGGGAGMGGGGGGLPGGGEIIQREVTADGKLESPDGEFYHWCQIKCQCTPYDAGERISVSEKRFEPNRNPLYTHF